MPALPKAIATICPQLLWCSSSDLTKHLRLLERSRWCNTKSVSAVQHIYVYPWEVKYLERLEEIVLLYIPAFLDSSTNISKQDPKDTSWAVLSVRFWKFSLYQEHRMIPQDYCIQHSIGLLKSLFLWGTQPSHCSSCVRTSLSLLDAWQNAKEYSLLTSRM